MNSDLLEPNIRLLSVLAAAGEYTIFKKFLSFLLKSCQIDCHKVSTELLEALRNVISKTLSIMFRTCPHYLTHSYLTTLSSYEKAFISLFGRIDLSSFVSEEFLYSIEEFESSVFFRASSLNLEWMDSFDVSFKIYGYEVIDKLFYVFETSNIAYSGTTGFKTWPASIHLANYIAEIVIYSPDFKWNHGPDKWKSVFELGSGLTGFLGIAMQDVLSSPKWTFSDIAMDNGQIIKTNGELNSFPKMDAVYMKHDWDFPLPADIVPAQLIVATDVIFDPEITLLFLKTAKNLIKQLTDDKGVEPDFLLCNAIRNKSSHEHFLENADLMGFDVEILDKWSCLKWARELRGRVAAIVNDYNIPLDESDPFMSTKYVPLTGDDTPTVIYYLKLK